METVIDRVETTGLTWLGLTLNCCRCHDHKYDPISQREFYQLFAFFNSVEEKRSTGAWGKNTENTPPLLTLRTPELDAKEAELISKLEAARVALADAERRLPEFVQAWEADVAKHLDAESLWVQPDAVECSQPGAVHSVAWQTDHGWRVVRTRRTIPIRSAFRSSLLRSPGC